MIIHDNLWNSMIICDNPWWSRIINGAPGSKLLNTDPCSSIMDILLKVLFKFLVSWGNLKLEPYGSSWIICPRFEVLSVLRSFETGAPWTLMDYHASSWIIMDYHPISMIIMDCHGLSWNSMDHHGLPTQGWKFLLCWGALKVEPHGSSWINMD